MRALGIALAVLAMSLTSGGVAYRSSADLASSGEAQRAADPDAGQCRVEQPTLTVLELPKLVERHEARSLRERRGETITAEVFDSLERTVDGLHRRGVALGDLHHRDVLVSDSGRVVVVDLATAWVLGPNPSPMRRRVFHRLRESDRVNLARMRARFLEDREADLERDVGVEAARRYRRAQAWKASWNRLRGKR